MDDISNSQPERKKKEEKISDKLSAARHKTERKLSALDEKVSEHKGIARSLDNSAQITAMGGKKRKSLCNLLRKMFILPSSFKSIIILWFTK